MPFAIGIILLDLTLIYHAARTGRLQPWAFIILMVPVLGAVAYIVVELVPEFLGGAHAQQARRRVANKLDPEKRYRDLSDQLSTTDTIANRAALAEECLARGRFEEAEAHYRHILTLPMGDEPAFLLGRARAEFGRNHPQDAIATLDEMRERWPDFETADGHLLYARALAAAGRTDEALAEFDEVSQYFPGAEAHVRHGELLELLGKPRKAKAVFAEILVRMKRAPNYARKAQAEWLAIAERRLSGR
jgi:hypothetical protein